MRENIDPLTAVKLQKNWSESLSSSNLSFFSVAEAGALNSTAKMQNAWEESHRQLKSNDANAAVKMNVNVVAAGSQEYVNESMTTERMQAAWRESHKTL